MGGLSQGRKQAVFLAILSLFAVVLPHPAALAATYSHAIENSNPDAYYGLGQTRYDAVVDCGGSEDVVFQPQWVIFPGSGNWAEMGTWHCHNNSTAWYWGIAINGNWQYDGTRSATAGQAHRFRLTLKDGYPNCNWRVYVDSTLIGETDDFCDTGEYIDAGLESHNANAVTEFDDSALQQQLSLNGGWSYWSGRDGSSVDSGMCGRWKSDTQWYAGQGVC